MNATTLERPDVAAYLAAVRSELADLPGEEREELLADVEASLVDAGEPPRLAPADFAAELREAAGLSPAEQQPAAARSLREVVRERLASDRARVLLAAARELAPIWWAVRAYVAVAALALLSGWGWPLGTGTQSPFAGLGVTAAALAAAVALSLWLGLRARRRGAHRLALAVNVVLALALVPVAAQSLDQLGRRGSSPVEVVYAPVSGLAYDGVPLQNVYPYTRDGELLLDVLLYDETGRPVQVGLATDDPNRRLLTTPQGEPVLNAFPIRYYEPGTRRVAQPELGPLVSVPEIATPELERDPR